MSEPFRVGIVAGFGDPIGRNRLEGFGAKGLTIVRQDLQTSQGRNPDIEAVVAEAQLWERTAGGKTVFICTPSTVASVPDGSWIELYNEPDLFMSPEEWARDFTWVLPIIREKGLILWAGGISNLNRRGFDWLRRVMDQVGNQITHIAVHRYTPGKDQNPTKTHDKFRNRDEEVATLKSIIRDRPFIVSEIGYHTAPVTTGWWLWKKTHKLSPERQAELLGQEVTYWHSHDATAVIIYQEQDGPKHDLDKYGLKWANLGPWKTDTIWGNPVDTPVVDPEPVKPPVAEMRGDILRVQANFCSITDPATNQPIFQNMYPSQDVDTRKRWRDIFCEKGDTHFQVGNPTTSKDYHDQSAYVDWLETGRMGEFNGFLRELIEEGGFWPIVFVTSGDRPIPGYYRRFVEAVDPDLRPKCIWVVGHECIPSGGWTTKAYCDANIELREALGGDPQNGGPYMAMHGGDGRLSFSSNPPEPDDPFAGDELGCWRKTYRGYVVGRLFKFFFYQSANLDENENLDPNREGTTAERMMECVTRVLGNRWNGAPDWFAGLDYRPIPVLWEQSEELFYRGRVSRTWMLRVWEAAKAMGYQGYGCGDTLKGRW